MLYMEFFQDNTIAIAIEIDSARGLSEYNTEPE